MATYAQDMHTPSNLTPTVTGKVARCRVCGCQWQVKADSDMKACAFCKAPEKAISVTSEKP